MCASPVIRYVCDHIVDQEGIHVDPEGAEAIQRVKTPENVIGLPRLMGMVNQLGKSNTEHC